MGAQPPETISLTATADGLKIARLYSIFYVTSYTKRGGSTMRYGSSTYYIEVYDGLTGKLLTAKPIKLGSRSEVLKITNTNIWLKSYNNDTKSNEVLIINNADGTTVLNAASLTEKNNGLSFDPTYEYYNPGDFKGTLLKAEDARIYALDEETGTATAMPDSIHMRMINRPFFEMSSTQFSDSYLSFGGDQRKRLVKKMKDAKAMALTKVSSADFINPFILGKLNIKENKEAPVFYNDCFFVLSKTKTSNQFEWQIDMVDTINLQSKWSTVIHKPNPQDADNKLTDILLQHNQLLLLGKNNMHLLNADTGKPVWQKEFPKPDSE